MQWDLLSSELVRALRGKRTQKQLSQKLGCRSNVLFAWENGRDSPSARKFFELCHATGKPPMAILAQFKRGEPESSVLTQAGTSEWLRLLAGNRSAPELARGLGRDRHAVGRWLRSQTEMPLPVLLQFIELTTLGLLDFLACVVDPRSLPQVALSYQRLEAARASAREKPWSHAIVHMVDLPSYARLPRHEPGWFASRLGITTSDEQECLALLVQMGRLSWDGACYRSTAVLNVDTRSDADATRQLAAFWMRQGAERVAAGGTGRFAFNTFAVSRKDFEQLRELQSRYFAELRSLIAESNVAEAVAVATFQLYPLFVEPDGE